jgi:hypothetical protein
MNEEMMERAKRLVAEYVEESRDKSDLVTDFTTYIVWFTKTLQNWKALVSTSLPDGRYYEVTHNGTKNETYVDVYVKITNFAVAGGN